VQQRNGNDQTTVSRARRAARRRDLMAAETRTDATAVETFLAKAPGDIAGLTTCVLAGIGDRVGLFRALRSTGPASSRELSAAAGTDERYTREWLAAMTGAGYVDYDPSTGTFSLSLRLPRHMRLRLEDNGGPLDAFFYGVSTLYYMTTSLAAGRAGLGTAGLPHPVLEQLGRDTGDLRHSTCRHRRPFQQPLRAHPLS
jgi:hypothetical protein